MSSNKIKYVIGIIILIIIVFVLKEYFFIGGIMNGVTCGEISCGGPCKTISTFPTKQALCCGSNQVITVFNTCCTKDCSCASSTCSGSTCSNTCGGTCSGTKSCGGGGGGGGGCTPNCNCASNTCTGSTCRNSCDTGNCAGTKSCASCGDGSCNGAETCSSCASDCGACAPFCGDGSCNGAETCSSCSNDCGACPKKSNGESCSSSSECDSSHCIHSVCRSSSTYCGDGYCDSGETCSCSSDCGACPTCGDGTCNGAETCMDCSQDCNLCAWCKSATQCCADTTQRYCEGTDLCGSPGYCNNLLNNPAKSCYQNGVDIHFMVCCPNTGDIIDFDCVKNSGTNCCCPSRSPFLTTQGCSGTASSESKNYYTENNIEFSTDICLTNNDCVAASCCHPAGCINIQYKPDCTGNNFCSAGCSGPLDCSAGSCGCVNNKCSIIPFGSCVQNWQIGTWTACSAGTQTRPVVDSNDCNNLTGKPVTTQSCNVVCTPNWVTSSWSPCPNGTQNRTVKDSNDCNITTGKPTSSQSCSIGGGGGGGTQVESCYDDIQNNDETGIDCGGSCDACEAPVTPTIFEKYGLILIAAVGAGIFYLYKKGKLIFGWLKFLKIW